MLINDSDGTYNGLHAAAKSKVGIMASGELTRLMQLEFMGEIKCCLDRNTKYFEILDRADIVRMKLTKSTPVIGYKAVLISERSLRNH